MIKGEFMKCVGLPSIIIVILFTFNLILLPGCSRQDESEKDLKSSSDIIPIQGGTYNIPLRSDPATLDPAYVQDIYAISIVHQIFDGLVRFDQYLSIKPAIAKTWQISENGKLYRFIIRENAQFHNLDTVTSKDVIFSLKRLLRTKPAPAVLPHLLKIAGAKAYRLGSENDISGLKIENKKIITIRLVESYTPFLTALGMYQAAIVPQKEVEKLGKDFEKKPVGSGPFKFISWQRKDSIHLQRFDNYYAGSTYLDRIQYKIYPGGQDSNVLKDFQNGDLYEMAVYGDTKNKLEDKKSLQWFHRPSLSLFFYGMNINHPNLSDQNIRKALSLAINRQAFVNQIYNGQFNIAKTILPPGMPGYTPQNQLEGNNPDPSPKYQNRALDKTDRSPIELEIVSGYKTPRVEKEIALMKEFWAPLKINVKVKYITNWKEFEAYLNSDSVQIYRGTWTADIPDPDNFLYSLFASDSPMNFTKLRDENIDHLLLKARGVTNPIDRAKLYQKIEADILELTPLIPLFYMSVDRVYQPYVKSVEMSALGAHSMKLNKIWLDKPQPSN